MNSSQPLRILLVGDYADDPRLGSSKVSHKLREELTALGHHCDTLFSDAIGARPRGRQTRQLVAPALAYRAIASAIAAQPYDVVDAASAEGLWFGLQRQAGRHRGTVLICRSHGLEHLNYQRMLDDARAGLAVKPWTRRLWYPASRLSQVAAAARLADRLLVLNGGDRQFAVERKWQRSDRVDVVPHGVSNRFLESRPNGQRRGGGFLWCGSWDHVKGISYLVDAWARLHASGVIAPLTVLGAGVPREQITAAFPEAVRPSITVLDRMPEEKVIEAYRRHDALVFPSTYEGFGLVVLEALSQGLPVIATAAGCAGELVKDGTNGVRVPPRDAPAIADAVRRLMADPALRARMSAAAAAGVTGMTWRRTAEQTVAVYRRAREQAA